MSVRDLSPLLSTLNLALWSKFVAPEDQDEIKQWSVCLEHRFRTTPEIGEDERQSERFLHFIVAHLRLLVPTKTNANCFLQGGIENEQLDPFRFSHHVDPVFLEDCEILCTEITVEHLRRLKSMIPWVVKLKDNWPTYYPLYLSLRLSEKAYLEQDTDIRHLLRVMALEALFSSGNKYGKKALVPRMGKFLGEDADLYEQYRNAFQLGLPRMPLKQVVSDVCDLRNRIAHGEPIPDRWLQRDRRFGQGYSLNRADELREAATSMMSASWRKLLGDSLQQVFADKSKVGTYLQIPSKGRTSPLWGFLRQIVYRIARALTL